MLKKAQEIVMKDIKDLFSVHDVLTRSCCRLSLKNTSTSGRNPPYSDNAHHEIDHKP
jgi:hypothetical protein